SELAYVTGRVIDENGLKTTFVAVLDRVRGARNDLIFNNTTHSFQLIVVQTKFLSEDIQRANKDASPTAATSRNGRSLEQETVLLAEELCECSGNFCWIFSSIVKM
ncbi:hypothetical protein L195_g018134, partial [Trifolium pratense]